MPVPRSASYLGVSNYMSTFILNLSKCAESLNIYAEFVSLLNLCGGTAFNS